MCYIGKYYIYYIYRYTRFQICLGYFGVKECQLLTMDMCFSLLILKEAWLFWFKAFHILVWESGSRMWLFSSNYHTGPNPSLLGICCLWNRNNPCQRIICHSCSVKHTTSLSLCCLAGAYTFVSNSWGAIPWLKHVQTCPNIAYSNSNHIFWSCPLFKIDIFWDGGHSYFCLVLYTPHRKKQFF